MPTLKDVAERACVSIATVSCCISGTRHVKPETRERVMEAIDALRYIPNLSARDLKKSDSQEVGIILTDIDDIYYADLLKGVTACMQKRGFNVNIAFSDGIPDNECALIESFVSRRIAGLVLLTCQPQNTAFFESTLENYGLPVMFIGHSPSLPEYNFVDFDNRRTTEYLTDSLLDKGYRSILLICGPDQFSCEDECVKGFAEAYRRHGLSWGLAGIHRTNMSKEDAFKTALFALDRDTPQVVITTSTNIAKGVIEAAFILGISIPDDLLLITFGEECWNHSNQLHGAIHTSRPAFKLGYTAAELLIENISSPVLFERQTVLLPDSIIETGLSLPDPKPIPHLEISVPKPCLNILMMDLNTSNAIRVMSGYFSNLYGVDINFDFSQQDTLLEKIIADNNRGRSKYDIYMFDVPWLSYLAQNGLIEDISEFVNGDGFRPGYLLPENLKNCDYLGRYYGIPIVGGAQLMFYRRDLFEDMRLREEFLKKYKIALRPPRTWTEFNGVAEFFTREYTPSSPVPYGTLFSGNNNQSLAPELLIRLWACGGGLFDSKNNVILNSAQNVKAFNIILKTLKYVEKSPSATSIPQAVEQFGNGKTAMLITYAEYASQITRLGTNIAGKVGYCPLPDRTPVSIGWNLGVSPFTKKKEDIFRFFNWLCKRDTSYYMTILNGQSAVSSAYANHELQKLYPWMSLTLETFPYCRTRTGPYKPNALVIPQSELEDILCDAFWRIERDHVSVKEALDAAQVKMKHLFRSYGY